jgi:predicted secreted hydrolase
MKQNSPWKTILITTAVLIAGGIALLLWWNRPDVNQLSASFLDNQEELPVDLNGYSRASEVIPLPFPETFGPHDDYRTEWWYYTGNLETDDGQHFGYQLTFFRRALLPETDRPMSDSEWRTSQLYFAHFALTDVSAQNFTFSERFSRGAAGLAGAQAAPYRVWLEDWEVRQTGTDQYQMTAQQRDIQLELTLTDEKGPILQGIEGYSQKGADPANASYYYSMPRLRSTGTVSIGEREYQVDGWSWKDHEFSTSVISEDQVGWDWFSIQLDNHAELMVYAIRSQDGRADEYSSGILVYPDGSTKHLALEDFSITVLDTWISPNTGGEYPAGWQVSIPEEEIELTVRPYISNQELLVTVIYWEGAVQVEGSFGGQPVAGSGYVELTGYTQSIKDRL